MKQKGLVTLMSIVAGMGGLASAHADELASFDKSNRLAVHLVGTDTVEERLVPDLNGDGIDDVARCYDLKILDIETDRVLGEGADCIANVTPVGSGFQIDATYYLHLKNGSMIIRGRNTAQPVLRETVSTSDGTPYTHSIAASGNWNAKLAGTGVYAKGEARLRVSGLMNISNVKGTPQDTAFIDALMMIELDQRR